MKRLRNKPVPRLSRDAERLINLANALAASGSTLEGRYWQNRLTAQITLLLDTSNDAAITTALDRLFETNLSANDALMDQVETLAESQTIHYEDHDWDVLLIAIPILAWSRYNIPSGPISREAQETITTHLQAHILAHDARAAVVPFCYSIDHMPEDFSALRKLTRQLGHVAIGQTRAEFDIATPIQTAQLLADTRFILAGVAALNGQALFRWQEEQAASTRTSCLEQWSKQGYPNLVRLLPGCTVECLLPDAYFASCRESDKRIRSYTIQAAVAYLEQALKTSAGDLCAVIAGIGDEHIDEYRIGFLRQHNPQVVHGVVWPLYGTENDDFSPAVRKQIENVLRQCKIGEIIALGGLFAPEFCDDCGAPLFPDTSGEMLHAELPENTPLHAAPLH